MSEVDDLGARVAELERRVEIQQGEVRKVAKLYMKETGADMATTMGALGKLEQEYKQS